MSKEQKELDARVQERRDFFADLSKHDLRTLLDRFEMAVMDEIHGTPGSMDLWGYSNRPKDKGGLVYEIRRRLDAGLLIEKERS